MVLPTDETLKNISDQLDLNCICYYHLPTGEVLSAPDIAEGELFDITGEDNELSDLKQKVAGSPNDYLEINPPDGFTSFGFMEDFIETISDGKTQNRFALAIRKKGPFRQFRNCLLDYPEVRQKWFIYKDQRQREYVKAIIEEHFSDTTSIPDGDQTPL